MMFFEWLKFLVLVDKRVLVNRGCMLIISTCLSEKHPYHNYFDDFKFLKHNIRDEFIESHSPMLRTVPIFHSNYTIIH